jgi:hypothetical protein
VPPSPDPTVNTLRASVAAHARWSRTTDRSAATEPARRAAWDRFERQVDPDGVLDPAMRAKLAENARRAHYQKMALARHLKARRAKRGAAG